VSGKPEFIFHSLRLLANVIMAWRGGGTALTMTMTIVNGVGVSGRRKQPIAQPRLRRSHTIVSSLHVDCC